jgi:hypothetical protein
MDNLRKSIEAIFNLSCPDFIINNIYDVSLKSNKSSKNNFLEQ